MSESEGSLSLEAKLELTVEVFNVLLRFRSWSFEAGTHTVAQAM